MNSLPFSGQARNRPPGPVEIPRVDRTRQTDPAGYLAEPGLVDAVNVALLLEQPLLLTGEPGTGKTQLAHRIAWELGFEPPLSFETKSTSTARDLFYSFDALRRFHAAHGGAEGQDNRDFITYAALGRAILLANEEATVRHLLTPGFAHGGKRRSVVLIDEVDKAPRDFPNDLLNEIDHMFFRVLELNNESVAAESTLRPVIIITSNSEKNLPDPFLRRCIYYHIQFPDRERLAQIVQSRLNEFHGAESPLLASALDFFQELRRRGLRKPPSSAELINWLNVLTRRGLDPARSLAEAGDHVASSLSTLIKTREDLEDVQKFAEEYLNSARKPPPLANA